MISRHARIQDKKATRRGVLLLLLSFLLFAGLLFFGIPALAKFANLIVNLQTSSQPAEKEDKTPPSPPVFFTVVSRITREEILSLDGSTEGGTTVFIYLNDDKIRELTVAENGNFSLELSLATGENTIFAKAKDEAGNESGESGKIKIAYDSEAPSLEIIQPQDGASFSGTENSIIVKGKTEKDTRLTVGDRLAIISPDGNFSQKIALVEGENIIVITVKDGGENETEKTLKVTYTP